MIPKKPGQCEHENKMAEDLNFEKGGTGGIKKVGGKDGKNKIG